MQKALFQTSCLAIFLAVSPTGVLADDAKSPKAETKKEKVIEKKITTRVETLIHDVQRAADLLDEASKAVLAGDGDRKTADVRRDTAALLAKTARSVTSDMTDLEHTEKAFIEAEDDRATALVQASQAISVETTEFEKKLAKLEAEPHSEIVKRNLPKIREALELLKKTETAFDLVKDVRVELVFSDKEYTEGAKDLVSDQLIAAGQLSNIVLMPLEPEAANKLTLVGKVPEVMTAVLLREGILASLEQLEIAKAVEATAPTILPELDFLAITIE